MEDKVTKENREKEKEKERQNQREKERQKEREREKEKMKDHVNYLYQTTKKNNFPWNVIKIDGLTKEEIHDLFQKVVPNEKIFEKLVLNGNGTMCSKKKRTDWERLNSKLKRIKTKKITPANLRSSHSSSKQSSMSIEENSNSSDHSEKNPRQSSRQRSDSNQKNKRPKDKDCERWCYCRKSYNDEVDRMISK